MGFRINTNVNAIDTQRNLMATSTEMSTTMRRLSSGLRINSAADDAAGLAIGQKLNAQVMGLNQAVRNAQDGISLVQTAEGALNETQSILQRMRQLAVQSANDTNTATDRTAIQSEMNQLATEISRISNTTSFNTKNLLAGGFKGQSFQIGANSGETMSLGVSAMDAASLGVSANGATISATQNTANISTIANVSSGFKNNINYSIKSTAVTAGSLTDSNGVNSKGVAQGQNIGNETLNAEGAFAGTTATNYTFRVSGVDTTGTKVTQVQYSSDGGSTWATAQGQLQSNNTYSFQVATSSATPTTDSGLTFDFSLPSSGAINPAIGDQFSFTANPTTSTATSAANVVATAGSTAGTVTAGFTTAGNASAGSGYNLSSLSGAVVVTLTSTGGMGKAFTATASIGGVAVAANNITLAINGTGHTTVAATPNQATATMADTTAATVSFLGMSYNLTGMVVAAANSSNTFTLGSVSAFNGTVDTNSNFPANEPGTYTTGANYYTTNAGTAVSPTNPTVTVSGQYAGSTGVISLQAVAGNFSAPHTTFTSTTGTTSTTGFTVNDTGGVTTIQYNGATFKMTDPSTIAAGDILTFAVANNLTTPGGDLAVTTATNTGASTATSASANTGNESLNTAGAFLGTATTNYLMKVSSVSSNQVTGVQFSTDGGATWATATATAQSDGSYHFQAQQKSSGGTNGSGGDSGMVFSFTAPTNGIAPQAGDQFSFQAVAATNASTATATTYTAGTFSNGTGGGGANPSATWTGTYSGPYTGAINISTHITAGAGGAANTWNPAGGTTVTIGSTTLDASQIQYNTTSNTLSFLGLTFSVAAGTQQAVAGASGTVSFTMPSTPLTVASQAQNANLAGNASVTTGNIASATAPTVTASATSVGAGIPGLGSGAILLNLKDFGTGGTLSGKIGINSVAFEKTGSNTATGFGAGAISAATTNTTADFSYNSTAGNDVYTAGATYGGTLAVTGADGNTYNVVVANSTTAGATVSIKNSTNTTTYATYNVSTSGQTAGDVVAINLDQANVTNTATQNIGAETSAVSGTYTGATNLQYTVKVAQIDANGNVSQIQLSTDGGNTYGSAIAAKAPYSNPASFGTVTSFDLSNGLTLTMTPGQKNQNLAAVGDTFKFTATATAANGGSGADLLQLQNTDASTGITSNIGSSQLLQNNQTTASLGAANLTLTANFGAMGTSGGVAAGSTTVTTQQSQAAVIGSNGQVVTNSTAYAGLDVTTQANAQSAISVIDTAINTVSLQRAQLGAIQNRLQHTINNLSVGSENLNAAQSRIMDVDVAAETVNMTKNQILTQAGISVLAQANQQPQMVLKLLG